MGFSSNNVDAGRASELVKLYFDRINAPAGAISFKIEDVKQNGGKDLWIVRCSFFVSINSTKRTVYEVKLDVKKGMFLSIQEKQQ